MTKRKLIMIVPNQSNLVGCKCGECNWCASVPYRDNPDEAAQKAFDSHRCEDYLPLPREGQ